MHEIRAGFLAAEAAFERLRRFRLERVTRTIALDAPVPFREGAKLILHGMPLSVLEEVWPRMLEMEEHRLASVVSIGGPPTTWRFNLDGFVAHTQRTDLSRQCYMQMFRDGGIEVVSGNILVRDVQREGFYAWGMELQIIGALSACQNFWRDIGVTPPLLVGLTLCGVKNWKVLRHANAAGGDLIYGVQERRQDGSPMIPKSGKQVTLGVPDCDETIPETNSGVINLIRESFRAALYSVDRSAPISMFSSKILKPTYV